MRPSKNRLFEFRSNMRKEQLQSLISKMRYEQIDHQLKHNIQALIDLPYAAYTP